MDIDTIVVRGNVKGIGEEALELFFTNTKKCGGGEIVSIEIESDSEAFITFQDCAGTYVHIIIRTAINFMEATYCLSDTS